MGVVGFDNYFMTALASSLVCYDAYKGRASGFSTRTLIALTLTVSLSYFNMSKDPELHMQTMINVTAAVLTGCVAVVMVYRANGPTDDDNLCSKAAPRWFRESVVYLAALGVSLLAVIAACHFSLQEAFHYAIKKPSGPLCTFQNFSNTIGLLPQLVLCRRRGAVPPAVVRFLLVNGCRASYELIMDLYVSYVHYVENRFSWHEACFMSGDLVAAVLLADFYYMLASRKNIIPFFFENIDLPLSAADDSEVPTNYSSQTMKQRFLEFVCCMRRLAVWALLATMIVVGMSVVTEIISASSGAHLVLVLSLIYSMVSMLKPVAARFGFSRFEKSCKGSCIVKEEKMCV
eukprot:TRINITY_DN74653_c0_g1_i1.p1 TRINITY_DN74653_c0_g1~~TRINITY_DN74653_c0_g1_i1.p1  ORF type:complete len:369 (-),score=35.83 TRINITY_DN74653_c0_g1_i1:53-1090(-)